MGSDKMHGVTSVPVGWKALLTFTELVKLLSGSSSSIAAGSSQSPKTDNTNYFQVESQNMMNQERDLLHQKSKLKRGKRLSEEHILHTPAFKRRKLDKVGNRSIFDTDREKYETDIETRHWVH